MANPFKVILCLVIIAGLAVVVTAHFLVGGSDSSFTLANLPSLKSSAAWIDQWRHGFADGVADIGVELIIFATLSVIGLLLILRAIASLILVLRRRQFLGLPISGLPREGRPPAGLAGRRAIFSRGFSGRMLLAFAGTVALFGVSAAAAVYFTLTHSLREHELKRAAVLALNVSDSAAGYLAAKRSAELPSLLRKFAADKSTAYIVVADRGGALVAHSLAELPGELVSARDTGLTPASVRRTLTIGSALVYEVAAPVLDGRAGMVRVGLWADRVESEIGRVVAPLMLWMLALVAAGMVSSVYFVWRINRPIKRLVRTAFHLSHGELDIPLGGIRDGDEFGELSRSLERMRSSVKAAMARLS